jgi:hypothetical protein
MSMLAFVRPHLWDLAVFVHVLGAMVLVGGVVTAAAASLIGWRDEAVAIRRFGYKTLLAVALPAWFVMRIGAEWARSKEGFNGNDDPTWLGIGYLIADASGVLLLVALILGGIGLRRSRSGGGAWMLKTSGVLATVLVAAYIVAVWAMGGKPS